MVIEPHLQAEPHIPMSGHAAAAGPPAEQAAASCPGSPKRKKTADASLSTFVSSLLTS